MLLFIGYTENRIQTKETPDDDFADTKFIRFIALPCEQKTSKNFWTSFLVLFYRLLRQHAYFFAMHSTTYLRVCVFFEHLQEKKFTSDVIKLLVVVIVLLSFENINPSSILLKTNYLMNQIRT